MSEGRDVARRPLALLGVLLALALVVRVADAPDPFSGKGFKSAFATHTTGSFAKNFADHGFAEASFMPYHWRVELEDGSVRRHWYAHHPPLYALLSGASLAVFGRAEWALGFPWLLFSLAAVVSLHRFFALVWGERVALVAALFLAVIPLSSWYATLSWCDGALIFLYGLLLHRYVLWMRSGANHHVAPMALWVFALGLFDWAGHFLLPGLGLHALVIAWRRGGWRACLPLAALPAAAVLSIGVHRVHMLLVLPPEVADADTSHTLAWVTSYPVPFGEFCRTQWRYFLKYQTEAVAALELAGVALWLVAAARGRLSAERWLALVLLPPGLIYVFLLPGRSINHDFFLFISLPGLGLAAACAYVALERVLRRAGKPLAWLAPLLLLLVVAGTGRRYLRIWAENKSDRIERLVESEWLAPLLADERAVVLTTTGNGLSLPFYAEAPILDGVDDVARLRALRGSVLSRLGSDRPVVFLFDLQNLVVFGELLAFLRVTTRGEPHLELVDKELAFELFDLTAWANE